MVLLGPRGADMRRAELDVVREASRRERKCDVDAIKVGCPGRCDCRDCLADRWVIACSMPDIIDLLDELVPQPGGP